MNVLFVEDDARTAAFVVKGLKQEGFSVTHVKDGHDGRVLAINNDYDVAVIDVMLPSLSGLDIVAAMRHVGKQTPVLFLSARNTVDDRVAGL